ncbi:hypothetical protein FGRMN_7261 [Fusarium graminum]|nr:hypothetical protein FGRMN_7261 [Fusarium graminum]
MGLDSLLITFSTTKSYQSIDKAPDTPPKAALEAKLERKALLSLVLSTNLFEDTHPSRINASLSYFTRGIVDYNPKQWPERVAAQKVAQKAPEAYALNRAMHDEAYRELLQHNYHPVGERNFKAVFGQQRQVSLFHRMENAGKMTFHIRLNDRARAKAAEWVQDMFYGENMDIVNCHFNGAVQSEIEFDTSFSNQGNAHFVIPFVFLMFKDGTILDARGPSRRDSVLIITPYSVQKNYYDLLLDELTVAEVPKSLVEVRTVDEAPSHEADIATIHCFWDSMCNHFCQPGHLAKDCPFQPRCSTCNGEQHATRNCPRVIENEITLSAADPVTADDGIDRDALNPPTSRSAGSKDVNVNKAERQAAFIRPQTQKAAMTKDFRDALKRAMDATTDQEATNHQDSTNSQKEPLMTKSELIQLTFRKKVKIAMRFTREKHGIVRTHNSAGDVDACSTDVSDAEYHPVE